MTLKPQSTQWRLRDDAGVLLIGHGTRDRVGTEEFFSLSRTLSILLEPNPVAAGLLEFQHPTIAEAWDTLMRQNVKHVHVAPLLLFAAGHARVDIPQIVERCRSQFPDVTFDQCRPLSRHRAIVELALSRSQEALAGLAETKGETAIVLVGRGNRDPCAQADLHVLGKVLANRLPACHLRTAFYAMAQPKLTDVLEDLVQCRRFETIIVQSHLLFQGRLYDAIKEQADAIARRHPSTRIITTRYLGPDESIARAIADRIIQQRDAICS